MLFYACATGALCMRAIVAMHYTVVNEITARPITPKWADYA